MTGISGLIAQKEQQARDDERDRIVLLLNVAAKNMATNTGAFEQFSSGILEQTAFMLSENIHRKANTNEV